MKRPEVTHTKPHNDEPAVPEIQGKAKHGKAKANPIVADTSAPAQKVYHSKSYKEIDNDLARDNMENDISAADLQDQ